VLITFGTTSWSPCHYNCISTKRVDVLGN